MIGAFGWGALAASSLILGGILALRVPISDRALGLVMAFGGGVLISAVAYDIVLDAFETADGGGGVAWGLAAGALVFYAGDWWLDRRGAAQRKRSDGPGEDASALPIVLGIVLDGIPESIVIGVGLLEGTGVSLALLAAVFLSNLPEAIAATVGLRRDMLRPSRILGLWVVVALVSGLSSLAGYGLFDGASPNVLAFVTAFAGGAVLTMLADTMMPEAFQKGGRSVGLLTTLGFGLAFLLAQLE
jgi:zinc transporter, ZIP family